MLKKLIEHERRQLAESIEMIVAKRYVNPKAKHPSWEYQVQFD